MNNPLIQGVLARTASAHGGALSQPSDPKPRPANYREDQASEPEEQVWSDTKARTEQILNEVLVNFGGARSTAGKSSTQSSVESVQGTPRHSKQPKQGEKPEQKVVFVYGEAKEAGYYTTEAPYRFGYRSGFPAHALAALDELESELGRGLTSLHWESAGEDLIVFGEASELAERFLAKAMRKVQERTRQQINYPGGSVEAQSYAKVGKQLADYVQQQFNWRLGAGESIGYLESTPAVAAVAYRGMFAPAGTFAWQGNRMWIKGSSRDVAKFLNEAVPWMLEYGNPKGR